MTADRFPLGRRAFVDTSAYYALTDARDASHEAANRFMASLLDRGARLFTSNFIIAETHALLLTRLSRTTALRVIQAIESGTTTVVRVSAADERRARAILTQYDDKDFSLTDATSFAIMERLHIPYALTFDSDFRQYGLPVVS